MKMKFKITYEWENEMDFEDYGPDYTLEEAMECYEQQVIEDYYGRLNSRAWNILPSEAEGEFIINWEDGRITRCITG
jgi:hypothetical protein